MTILLAIKAEFQHVPSDVPVSRNLREMDGGKLGRFDVRGASGTARIFDDRWEGGLDGEAGEDQAARRHGQGSIVVPDQGREQGPKTNGTVVGRAGRSDSVTGSEILLTTKEIRILIPAPIPPQSVSPSLAHSDMSILSVAIATISSYPLSFSSSPSPSPSPPTQHPLATSYPPTFDHITRHNEHLAVLLPKDLWKSDHLASYCDRFGCSIKFSVFERRHHCRKCGGIFCNACSSRATRLLDTSSLDFVHPPKGVPISTYDSPTSLITECRVCDECWDLIHGFSRSTHSSESSSLSSQPSTPSLCSSPLTPSSSGGSSFCGRVATSPIIQSLNFTSSLEPQSLHTIPSASSIDCSAGANRPKRMSIRHSRLPLPMDLPTERSYGELDAYPLRRSSVLCKATGGGRWEPKQSPVYAGYRPPIPGGKALFEIEMENEEREERLRRENPVVKDGDFRYRFSREPEPVVLSRSPYHLATF